MPYLPAPGYIMCRPLKKESKTASGLSLPPSEQEHGANIAEVLTVGAALPYNNRREGDVVLAAPACKSGDIIAYQPYSDVEVENESSFDKIVFVPFDKIVGYKKNEGAN